MIRAPKQPAPPAVESWRRRGVVTTHSVVLLGNPNVGKTTLFNALTGENARVGNYPGVTVERRVGRWPLSNETVELVDVPGTYSLSARSTEEQVALEAALGFGGNPRPSLAIVVVDAGQLARNLYLATQLVECQVPVVLALTMMDEVASRPPRPEVIGELLSVPCVPINPREKTGLRELERAVEEQLRHGRLGNAAVAYSSPLRADVDRIADHLPVAWRRNVESDRALSLWALLSLTEDDELEVPRELRAICSEVRRSANAVGRDLDLEIIGARYRRIEQGLEHAYASNPPADEIDWTERADRILLHPTWGFGIFVVVMLVLFQALFTWSDPAIGWIESGIGVLQSLAVNHLPSSLLSDLLIEGVIGGVGNVVVFLPQIALLFFLMGLLEDSGYMARVAYLMDRVLRGVGLHGRAFVPMLSGLACAVPAILATRLMERRRDRLLTMMVVPLMTCSARLPVYTLVIAALFPPSMVFGWIPVQGLLMVGMYVFSIVITLVAAAVLGRTIIRGRHIPLLLELPHYRWPSLSTTLRAMFHRTRQFLAEAGTVILGFTIVLWVLLSFPKPEQESTVAVTSAGSKTTTTAVIEAASVEHGAMLRAPSQTPTLETARALRHLDTATLATPSTALRPHAELATGTPTASEANRTANPLHYSFAGRLGRWLEPVTAPLGFDWKLNIGVIGAFSAREVFISTMGLVFGLEDADERVEPLRDQMRAERRPDGSPAYSPLVGLSLMVFFALACQCMSTLAVVKRETQSWRWPLVLFVYMTGLAYAASFIVYQGGKLLGFTG